MKSAAEAEHSASVLEPIILAKDALGRGRDGRPVLLGGRCNDCQTVVFPKPGVCPSCMSEDIVLEEMPHTGNLYSFTVLHVGPARMNKPVTLGYVDLTNGVRVFSHLADDGGKLAIDQQVELRVAAVGRETNGQPIETFVFAPSKGSR